MASWSQPFVVKLSIQPLGQILARPSQMPKHRVLPLSQPFVVELSIQALGRILARPSQMPKHRMLLLSQLFVVELRIQTPGRILARTIQMPKHRMLPLSQPFVVELRIQTLGRILARLPRLQICRQPLKEPVQLLSDHDVLPSHPYSHRPTTRIDNGLGPPEGTPGVCPVRLTLSAQWGSNRGPIGSRVYLVITKRSCGLAGNPEATSCGEKKELHDEAACAT